jgi:hypothetical protein
VKGVELNGSYAGTKPIPAERAGTAIFIPVTNDIEALNSKLRRAVTPGAISRAHKQVAVMPLRQDGHRGRIPIKPSGPQTVEL